MTKKCCEGCKKGKGGANPTCKARKFIQQIQLKQAEITSKNKEL